NNSTNNSASVYQGFTADGNAGSAISGATATINQGKNNAGDVAPAGSEARDNKAVIQQTADDNTADINQGGGTGYYTTAAGKSVGSEATINQSVIGNQGYIWQGTESGNSQGSKGSLTQSGADNEGYIFQGLAGSDIGSTANITQAGSNGNAYVLQGQVATSTNNVATINQTANANGTEAGIYQGFGSLSTSTDDKASITQGGTGTQYAQIVQGGGSTAGGKATSLRNEATITQADNSTDNQARISQGRFDSNVADVTVNAEDNDATIEQSGTGNNAAIDQGRPTNITTAGGALVTGGVSIGSVASIKQSGGNSNNGVLTQAGESNGASLVQTGSTNQARLYQNSTGTTGNDATITQMGNNNILRGSATGEFALQSGNANTLMLQQTNAMGGAGNIANVNQVGSSNGATISQSNQ
ncbi:MAG TPA: hypothetical protein VGB67_11590, partial [Fibrella sp.]